MKRKNMRGLFSLLLTMCILFSMIPSMASAASLCPHGHENCGYQAAVEGRPCSVDFAHVHDSACGYVEATAEVHCTVECDACSSVAQPAAMLSAMGATVPAASVSFSQPYLSIQYWEPLAPSLTFDLSSLVKVLSADGSDATDQTVAWESSNPNLPVDQAGVLTYKNADERATITVTTTDGGFKASCEVHVWVPGTEVVDATFSLGDASTPERRYDYLILSQSPNEVALVNCLRDSSVTNPDPFKIEESVTYPGSGSVYKVVGIGYTDRSAYLNSAVDYHSNLVIPDSVRYIGEQVFMGSPASSVTFGAGLKEIGASAFQFCLSLQTIDFSKATSLEKIGDGAFAGSYALKGPVVLPDSVKTLGSAPFTCVNLAGYLSIPKGAALTADRIFTFGRFDVSKDAGYIVVDAPDITLNAGDAATGRDPYGFTPHTVFRSSAQIEANIPEPAMNALNISMDYSGFDGSTLPGVYNIPLLGKGNTTCPQGWNPGDEDTKQIFKEYSIVVRRGTVTVNPVPPTITIAPATQTVDAGSAATITATVPARDKAALHGKDYTLQWQKWSGTGWENVGVPVTKPNNAVAQVSYTLSSTTNADNGARFRCKVEDAYGAAISAEATVFIRGKDQASDPVGSLTITKTVAGDAGERSRGFTFVLTMSSQSSFSYTGSKSGTIKSGDSIVLAHGQSITVFGLPAGTSFTVKEVESGKDGYVTSSTGSSGIITGGAMTAAFTNSKFQTSPINPEIPMTGDEASLPEWIVFLAMSACVFFLVTHLRKRRRKS